MIKQKRLFILGISVLLLAGCWDSINIEERGFIIGTSIDLDEMKEEGTPIYSVTDQIVLPESFGTTDGGSDQKAFYNLTETGSSIYQIDEVIPQTSSKTPYYEHLKILVVSEEVAKTDHLFIQLLDRYLRDITLRRGIKVIVAEDEAKSLLDLQSPESKLPALQMNDMLERASKSSGYFHPKTLGEVEAYNLHNRSFILPVLAVKNEQIERTAGAVFQGAKAKMVGKMNNKEMIGHDLYREEAEGTIIEFTYHDQPFAFKINRIQNKQEIDTSNQSNIKVTMQMILFGTIKEASANENLNSEKELQAIEETLSKHVEKLLEDTIHKAQNEFHADVFRLWQSLEMKDLNTWKKVKDDWEEGENHFANNVTFDIEVKAHIYSVGTSNKTR